MLLEDDVGSLMLNDEFEEEFDKTFLFVFEYSEESLVNELFPCFANIIWFACCECFIVEGPLTIFIEFVSDSFWDWGLLHELKLLLLPCPPTTSINGARGGGDGDDDAAELDIGDIDLSL